MKINGVALCFLTLCAFSALGDTKCLEVEPLTPQPANLRNFYVSNRGSDESKCTKESPCREVRRVLKGLRPGDTVHLGKGHYLGFDIDGIRGFKGSPVAFVAEGKDAFIDVTADRTEEGRNRDTIFITGSAHVILDGLNSERAFRAGLRIDNSQDITVRNGTFSDAKTWGIFCDHSRDVLLENNHVFGSKLEHGIYISDSSQRPTVRYNHLHDNAGCGLHMNGDLTNGPPGVINGGRIEGNIIHDNGVKGGAGINMDGVQDSLIANNILYNNHATGIVAFQQDAGDGPRNLKIINNTVVMAENGRQGFQILASTGKIFVRNNIFYHPTSRKAGMNIGKADLENIDSDYNLVDRYAIDEEIVMPAQWKEKFKKNEQHSLPIPDLKTVFVDPVGFNFALLPNSLAVGKGAAIPEVARTAKNDCRRTPTSIGAMD